MKNTTRSQASRHRDLLEVIVEEIDRGTKQTKKEILRQIRGWQLEHSATNTRATIKRACKKERKWQKELKARKEERKREEKDTRVRDAIRKAMGLKPVR